jgi:hypothetical protein
MSEKIPSNVTSLPIQNQEQYNKLSKINQEILSP